MALTPLFSKMSKMLVLFKNVVVMHYMYLLIVNDWFAFLASLQWSCES